ncbi:wings apart-like protein 2 isoform X2 [Manihot esculenta]|uniref:wings apart-like protein 2 isoform X2 n=1 Tax=Manihot esculenta TaxID=3983 RepID=UPI000B5D371D|nr:wings apart-like protein 2 isoform X2 [Manihot esculenta]
MIVRTYGRRNRGSTGTFSDSLDDDVPENPFRDSFTLSSSQENPSQDLYSLPFSSEESSSLWPSLDPDPYNFNSSQENAFSNGVVSRKSKKPRNGKLDRPAPAGKSSNSKSLVPVTSTLMEAQEFGEMMEHVDEVNFGLDGLRKGQPVRIRRASLSSLLSICGTTQQRRLLRTQGLAKTIIDAILGLSFDDSSSNLAAATLFYVLMGDGQDDHLLESPSCIRFLIKLLKPVISTAAEDKTRNIGNKLLSLRKDSDILRDTTKLVDSSSADIVSKVQRILVSSKDLNSYSEDDNGMERPELSPKWIALLTIEKACLSKISFEDTSGMIRKTGGNFKEELRELGGLDAVFEVALKCHSVMETWKGRASATIQDAREESGLQSLVLLLKCLKIMENATFLSKDNQSHLLGMKRHLDSHGYQFSFTKLIISVIKILSGLYLLKSAARVSNNGKHCSLSDGSNHASDSALITEYKVSADAISRNCSGAERTSSKKNFNPSQKSISQFSFSASSSESSSTFMNDACQLRMRVHSSTSSSCSGNGTLRRSTNSGTPTTSNELRTRFGLPERTNCTKITKCELLEDDQDPYAFDEDEFQLTKWDLLSGRKKKSRPRNRRAISKDIEDEYQCQLTALEESSNGANYQQKSRQLEHHPSQENSHVSAAEKEYSTLLADCLLTAVKVLMNLTNDNPIGCEQIAACGGLETMSSLIAGHFPSFSSPLPSFSEIKEDASGVELENQNDNHLTDQELDFLVAILGLLVNLVEKDGHNRSRLAATTVSLPSSEGLHEENRRDVIPLLCSIFLANQGAGDASGEGNTAEWNDEAAVLQGEKEAEKMIVEAYSALLLAFLSTESKSIRDSIAHCLPNQSLAVLVPVLERFVAFHLTLNMISPETHKAVSEVIESCRIP